MGLNYLYQYCGHCGGDGVEEVVSPSGEEVEETCHQCLGNGLEKKPWGVLSDELMGEE